MYIFRPGDLVTSYPGVPYATTSYENCYIGLVVWVSPDDKDLSVVTVRAGFPDCEQGHLADEGLLLEPGLDLETGASLIRHLQGALRVMDEERLYELYGEPYISASMIISDNFHEEAENFTVQSSHFRPLHQDAFRAHPTLYPEQYEVLKDTISELLDTTLRPARLLPDALPPL